MEQLQELTSQLCVFCDNIGHNIRNCRDPIIEESWKYVISQVDLTKGSNLTPSDLTDARIILNDFNFKLIRILGARYANVRIHSSLDHHINEICNSICMEAEYFSQLDELHRNEYINWLHPNLDLVSDDIWVSDDDTIIGLSDDDDDGDGDGDGENDGENDNNHADFTIKKIEPLLFCLETQQELDLLTECAICYETKKIIDMDNFQCEHPFCHICVMTLLKQLKSPNCPFCRVSVKTIEVKDYEKYYDIQYCLSSFNSV